MDFFPAGSCIFFLTSLLFSQCLFWLYDIAGPTAHKRSKETHDPCASDQTAHKHSKETLDPCASDPTAHKRSKETHDPCASFLPYHYIYVGLAAIAISQLNSYLQPHHSSTASTVLTYRQAEELSASNYPCPPGYRSGSVIHSMEPLVGYSPDKSQDRKSTRLNSSHRSLSRMPSSA